MYYYKTFLSVLFVLTASLVSYGQDFDYFTALETRVDSPSLQEQDNVYWEEDILQRTLYSATYYGPHDQIKVRTSSVPIHYYNDQGVLVRINIVPVKVNDQLFSASEQEHPTFFAANGSISLSVDENQLVTFGGNNQFNGHKLEFDYQQRGQSFVGENNEGIIKEIVFRENGVKYNYHVFENAVGQNEYMFYEELTLPEGSRIVEDTKRGRQGDKGWEGVLLVLDRNDRVITTIHEAVCFDQTKAIEIAGYNFWQEDGKWHLETKLSPSWVNDANRQFPIIVDPIVTGPTTTWAGGTIPSCLIPTYSQDSIQVTIPANITVTELNVTASYYADPFAGAEMGEGSMYFSTDCANSQTFTITGPNATTAGTAYLDYFNLLSPMMCCFPESCSQQTFWLSYHLGRTVNGAGCAVNYIRYDPTTSWPFEATVIGHTAEHASTGWNISNAPICSDKCDLTGTVYVQYGVAPYTITHPWSQDTLVVGSNSGCGSGYTVEQIDLIIPNCPVYCDTINTSLSIPPPVVWDACGNMVPAANAESVNLKPTPTPVPVYDSIVCSGVPFTIELNQCMPSATTVWTGNGVTGWSTTINHTLNNGSGDVDTMVYLVYSIFDGCDSDTMALDVYIYPNPDADYNVNPDPVIAGVPAQFSDQSVFQVSPGVYWAYEYGDGNGDVATNSEYTYAEPGQYPFCFYVENEVGCIDSLCELLAVVPAELQLPNVITVDGDLINDYLEFQYLEFYGPNHLTITNRWGNIIYETDNYLNDWTIDSKSPEGVYFFRLDIKDSGDVYSGFFHVLR